jgi:hypothetical protein
VSLEVKADEEIRADAHQLPENKCHQQVARDANAQHREREQRKVLEEAVESAAAVKVLAVAHGHLVIHDVMQLVVHVTGGINMNTRRDERHHAKHHHRERVDVVADGELQVAELRESVPIAGDVLRWAVRGVLFAFFGV